VSEIALLPTLSLDEATEYGVLKDRIRAGLRTFYEVGDALLAIRDGKLYREDYKTFEEFCQAEYGITRQRAHQLIESADDFGKLSTLVDKTELPENEKQVRALKQFDTELRPVVLRLARGEAKATGKPLTAAMITRVGEVLLEAEHTGHVDIGNGEGTPVTAAITAKEFETTQRQKQHQRDHYEGKDNQSKWKDHLSELEPEDQQLVREVTRDITSGYGGDAATQRVAFDAKALARTDTWEQATPEQKREMLHERFAEKQAKSYEKPEPKQVQTTPDDVKSLMVACQNLIECAGIKTVNSFVKEQIRSNLEKVNEIMGRYLA
jgi:uncharacterized tellurite resistance protein B-like protein